MQLDPRKNDPSKTWVGFDKEELATTWFALLEYKQFVEAELLTKYAVAHKDGFVTNGDKNVGDKMRITNYGDRKEAFEEQTDLYESLRKTSAMLAQLSDLVAEEGIT